MDRTYQLPSTQTNSSPNYQRAFLLGLATMAVLIWLHRLMVMLTYSNGYYTEHWIIVVLLGVGIGLAVRFGVGIQLEKANIRLMLIAALIALLGVFISDYLVVQFLNNQYAVAQGWGELAFIQPVNIALVMLLEYYAVEPFNLVTGLLNVVMAAGISTMKTPGNTGWNPSAEFGLFGIKKTSQSQRTAFDSTLVPGGIEVPAEGLELGTPLREYRVDMKKLGTTSAVLGMLMVASLVAASMLDKALMPMFLMLAGLFMVLTIYHLVILLIHLNHRIVVLQKGLTVTQRNYTRAFRWENIERLYHQYMRHQQGLFAIVVHNYRLIDKSGQKVVIRRWMQDIDELGNTLHEAVTKAQMPAAIETLKRGDRLDFGALQVDRQGIYTNNQKKFIPWNDVKGVNVFQGTVSIKQHSRKFGMIAVQLKTLSNPHLFYQLVEKATVSTS